MILKGLVKVNNYNFHHHLLKYLAMTSLEVSPQQQSLIDFPLTQNIIKWLNSCNWHPSFNESEFYRLVEEVNATQSSMFTYQNVSIPYNCFENSSFEEMVSEVKLNFNLNKVNFDNPTSEEIKYIQTCVRNHVEWAQAYKNIHKINQTIVSRGGNPYPFEFERIQKMVDGLLEKILVLTSTKSSTKYNPPTENDFINVHSIPGIVNEYDTVEKALMFHRKLIHKIGQGLFQLEKIKTVVDSYHGENYLILYEVFYNIFQIENYHMMEDIANYKHRNTAVMFWLLQLLDEIRLKIDTEYEKLHANISYVLDSLGPL